MAQSADLTAYKAALAEKKKGKKGGNVYYFPIGRSLTTLGGVLKMINAGNLQKGVEALMDGNLDQTQRRLGGIFEGGDVKGGAKIIATGIILGKTLDHMQTNPRVKMGKYGVKLV